jgi:hypothetical protein
VVEDSKASRPSQKDCSDQIIESLRSRMLQLSDEDLQHEGSSYIRLLLRLYLLESWTIDSRLRLSGNDLNANKPLANLMKDQFRYIRYIITTVGSQVDIDQFDSELTEVSRVGRDQKYSAMYNLILKTIEKTLFKLVQDGRGRAIVGRRDGYFPSIESRSLQ